MRSRQIYARAHVSRHRKFNLVVTTSQRPACQALYLDLTNNTITPDSPHAAQLNDSSIQSTWSDRHIRTVRLMSPTRLHTRSTQTIVRYSPKSEWVERATLSLLFRVLSRATCNSRPNRNLHGLGSISAWYRVARLVTVLRTAPSALRA
jgi:hypothetical protein